MSVRAPSLISAPLRTRLLGAISKEFDMSRRNNTSISANTSDAASSRDARGFVQTDLLAFTLALLSVVNTHEHFDHVGGNGVFPRGTLLAAHSSAARKLAERDRFVTMIDEPVPSPRVNLLLHDGSVIDLGDRELRVVHTPGHTSGSACLFDSSSGLLFSGDTLFAGGVLSYIAESGSLGDYVASLSMLASLRVSVILPGHGRPSIDFGADIARATQAVRDLLAGKDVSLRRQGGECGECVAGHEVPPDSLQQPLRAPPH